MVQKAGGSTANSFSINPQHRNTSNKIGQDSSLRQLRQSTRPLPIFNKSNAKSSLRAAASTGVALSKIGQAIGKRVGNWGDQTKATAKSQIKQNAANLKNDIQANKKLNFNVELGAVQSKVVALRALEYQGKGVDTKQLDQAVKELNSAKRDAGNPKSLDKATKKLEKLNAKLTKLLTDHAQLNPHDVDLGKLESADKNHRIEKRRILGNGASLRAKGAAKFAWAKVKQAAGAFSSAVGHGTENSLRSNKYSQSAKLVDRTKDQATHQSDEAKNILQKIQSLEDLSPSEQHAVSELNDAIIEFDTNLALDAQQIQTKHPRTGERTPAISKQVYKDHVRDNSDAFKQLKSDVSEARGLRSKAVELAERVLSAREPQAENPEFKPPNNAVFA